MVKIKDKIYLISCMGGYEEEWLRNKLLNTYKISYSQIFRTKESNEVMDNHIYISLDTFIKKFGNGDFLGTWNSERELIGLSKIDDKEKIAIVFAPYYAVDFIYNKLKLLGQNTNSIVKLGVVLTKEEQEEKLYARGKGRGVLTQINTKRIKNKLLENSKWELPDFDVVLNGKYENDIFKYLENEFERFGVMRKLGD